MVKPQRTLVGRIRTPPEAQRPSIAVLYHIRMIWHSQFSIGISSFPNFRPQCRDSAK